MRFLLFGIPFASSQCEICFDEFEQTRVVLRSEVEALQTGASVDCLRLCALDPRFERAGVDCAILDVDDGEGGELPIVHCLVPATCF